MRHLERKTIVWKFQTHPFGVHSDKQALELSLLVKWQTGIMRWWFCCSLPCIQGCTAEKSRFSFPCTTSRKRTQLDRSPTGSQHGCTNACASKAWGQRREEWGWAARKGQPSSAAASFNARQTVALSSSFKQFTLKLNGLKHDQKH